MKRAELLKELKSFAKANGLELSRNAEMIAEAKRRMNKGWYACPFYRDADHFCGCAECLEKGCKLGLFKKGIEK